MVENVFIYVLLLLSGVISALVYNRKERKESGKKMIPSALLFSTIYFYAVVVFRTMVGNGRDFLSTSFADKTLRAYVKVGVLELAVFFIVFLFLKKTKEQGEKYIEKVVGIFAAECLLYIVLVDVPRMYVLTVLGGAALIAATLLYFLKNTKFVETLTTEKIGLRKKYVLLGIQILFFCVLFCLTGTTEMYVSNYQDIVFSYTDFIGSMIVFSVFLIATATILICHYLPEGLFKITWLLTFLYCISGYIQSMALNGAMNEIDGVSQSWDTKTIFINLSIWIVLAVVLFVLSFKVKKADTVYVGITCYLTAIQIITLVYLVFSSNVLEMKQRQLVEDNVLSLSGNDNVIVFMLDAYDVQMLQKVLEDDPSYLQPLHDFTYYDHMESRYGATDGSLPYLLTGCIAEEEKPEKADIYANSTFLKDIKDNGYSIKMLTEAKYVEPFKENLIENYVDTYENYLDFGKTVSQMSRCIRYRNVLFALKPFYQYESYSLTNMIEETNVYLFGTDSEFYEKVDTNGITIDESINNAMRVYHLYGAHSPYFLTENAELDYNSNPIAQWKGSLKIVYRYLEQLKEKGLYDNATVIVMADHGLNRTQRIAMDEWNISVNENSNPIFFIKRSKEQHNELIINNREVSHDDFFATIIKSMDPDNNNYGKAIWELKE